MAKPPTASVAWTPISIPGSRLLRRCVTSDPTPINAADPISVTVIMPKEAVPCSTLAADHVTRAQDRRGPQLRQGHAARRAATAPQHLQFADTEPQAKSPTKRRYRG